MTKRLLKDYTISELMKEAKQEANRHGWKVEWHNAPTYLMLMVTELSEAMECWRDDKKKEFSEEIADTVIRILHLCGDLEIDLEYEIVQKMNINVMRPYKHSRRRM